MCTLVFAWQVFDAPLVVAANRDELTDRPSQPPAVHDWGQRVVAPVDEEAGGTWLGYNEQALFVAITNRWTDEKPSDDLSGERSRGLLVRDALERQTAEDAARFVERAVGEHGYDGFNLVVADANDAIYVEWDGELAVSTLSSGVHVVVNVGITGNFRIPDVRREAGEKQANSARKLLETLQVEPGESAIQWRDRAAERISDHEFGVCIHGDQFGTRSSSLLVLHGDDRSYRFADGPPCRTPYRAVESHI